MSQDTSSIQTIIQQEPCVRVSAAYRECSAVRLSGVWYWEVWCFSDDPRLKSFLSPSTAWCRGDAQSIHDGIIRSVLKHLK